jgi:hypothetical protein
VHAAIKHAACLHATTPTLAHYTFGRYNSRNTGLTCPTYTTGAAGVAYYTCSRHRHLCCIIASSADTTYIACACRFSRQRTCNIDHPSCTPYVFFFP